MITIREKFKQLREHGRKAFIAYVPFGFPNVKSTKDIVLSLERAGVDIIELGIPFSDPLADGPIIQEATTCALKRGASIAALFATLNKLKKRLKIPLVIMTYYNPVLSYGVDRFFRKLRVSRVSGVMIVDLPIYESREYLAKAKRHSLETVFFITPTTAKGEMAKIARASKGFIYYISVTGITGPRSLSYKSLVSHVKGIKKITASPVCVGFGIHTHAQVKEINRFADGVIVGSSIVKFIAEHSSQKGYLGKLKRYVRTLRGR